MGNRSAKRRFRQFTHALDFYDNWIHLELEERWNGWEKDLTKSGMYEVIGGLMARQVSLASRIVTNHRLWSPHVGPILLRAMVDTAITSKWILADPLSRSRSFILHGLGQEKLTLEHHKALQEERGEREIISRHIEFTEQWLNSQRFTFLTEVNLGSWSGTDTRKMAEEVGLGDMYRFAYTPFSSAVHGTWPHLAKHNLWTCSKPLHKHHKVPVDTTGDPDPMVPRNAGKYLARTFDFFDETFGKKTSRRSGNRILVHALNSFFGEPIGLY